MSPPIDSKPLNATQTERTDSAQEFASYWKDELERLRSSGEVFDEQVYQEAAELIIRKLEALEQGAL
jgi:hypothetical protein